MANSFLSSSDLMNVLIPIHSARIDSLLEFFLGQSHMHMLVISRSKAKCNSPGLFPRNSLHNLRQQSRDASRKSVFGVLLNLRTTPSFSKCPIRIEVSNHQKQKSTPLGSDWRVFDWRLWMMKPFPTPQKWRHQKMRPDFPFAFSRSQQSLCVLGMSSRGSEFRRVTSPIGCPNDQQISFSGSKPLTLLRWSERPYRNPSQNPVG